MAQELIGLNEAAKRLGVSVITLRRLTDSGDIRAVNVAARRLIPMAELDRIALMGAGKARQKSGGETPKAQSNR